MKNTSGKNLVLLAVVLLAALWCGLTAPAEAATGSWTANTDTDIAGYYADMAPGPCAAPGPWARVAVFPKDATTGIFPTPTDGVYCGRLAAFDTAGNVSPFSAPAEVEINVNPPAAPAGFSLTAP